MSTPPGPRTLFDKIWDAHVVAEMAPGVALLHVDRHFVHDLGGHAAFTELERQGLSVRNPEQVFAVPDHVISTAPGRTGGNAPWSQMHIDGLRRSMDEATVSADGIRKVLQRAPTARV